MEAHALMRSLLCLVTTAVLVAPESVAAPRYCCGDTTEVSDAQRALRRAVGSTAKCTTARCDCDGNGAVSASDAMEILKQAVGTDGSGCPSTTSTTMPGSCGDGTIGAGEDCEPPLSFCRGGCNPFTGLCVDYMCSETCTCPAPTCGDSIIDARESCDPPGSPCANGTCNSKCRCSRR